MKYLKLVKNLKVSPVSLGCIGFSHEYGTPPDKKIIAQAIDIGYNFLIR